MADDREDRELVADEIEALNQSRRNAKDVYHQVSDGESPPSGDTSATEDVEDLTPDELRGEVPEGVEVVGVTRDGEPVTAFGAHLDDNLEDLRDGSGEAEIGQSSDVRYENPTNGREF